MDTKATVQALMDAIQSGDFEKAKTLFADDFKFSGPVPEPISGEAWIGMSVSLKNAFPDLDYQFKIESVDGDTANISSELKGTHKGDFDLTAMDMGVIPATGKSFKAAHEHGKVSVRDGNITAWAMEHTEGAGLMAILGQLGVKTPSM
ncbi:MAG: ester cyclase [Anaerolineales bacterium]